MSERIHAVGIENLVLWAILSTHRAVRHLVLEDADSRKVGVDDEAPLGGLAMAANCEKIVTVD